MVSIAFYVISTRYTLGQKTELTDGHTRLDTGAPEVLDVS